MDANNEVKVEIKDTTVTDAKPQDPADLVLTDSKGRKLKIKEPGILAESRLVRTMGEAASNTSYMYGYVIPAVQVVEINGDPVGFPLSIREVEALIIRLGREGLECVLGYQTEQMEKLKALKNSAELQDSETDLKN